MSSISRAGAVQNPTRTDAVNGSLAYAGPQVDGGQIAPRSGGSGKGDIFYNARWQMNVNGLYQLPWDSTLERTCSAARATRVRSSCG